MKHTNREINLFHDFNNDDQKRGIRLSVNAKLADDDADFELLRPVTIENKTIILNTSTFKLIIQTLICYLVCYFFAKRAHLIPDIPISSSNVARSDREYYISTQETKTGVSHTASVKAQHESEDSCYNFRRASRLLRPRGFQL